MTATFIEKATVVHMDNGSPRERRLPSSPTFATSPALNRLVLFKAFVALSYTCFLPYQNFAAKNMAVKFTIWTHY